MATNTNLSDLFSGTISLADVIYALRNNINKGLNVATLAEVKEINFNDNTASVSPFPLIEGEDEKNIIVYGILEKENALEGNILTGYELITDYKNILNNINIGDIVLVLFLNRNFIQNYKQVFANQKRTTLTENSDLHSDKYGIIIAIVKKKEE